MAPDRGCRAPHAMRRRSNAASNIAGGEPAPRDGASRPSVILKQVLVACLLLLALPATAHANGSDDRIIHDCQNSATGALTGNYTKAQLNHALNNLPGDVQEYTGCYDAIRQELLASGGGGPNGRTGTGGSGSGGLGGGAGGANGGGLGSAGGGTGGAGTAGSIPDNPPPPDAAKPVQVAGATVAPGALPQIGKDAHRLPTALIVPLALLALARARLGGHDDRTPCRRSLAAPSQGAGGTAPGPAPAVRRPRGRIAAHPDALVALGLARAARRDRVRRARRLGAVAHDHRRDRAHAARRRGRRGGDPRAPARPAPVGRRRRCCCSPRSPSGRRCRSPGRCSRPTRGRRRTSRSPTSRRSPARSRSRTSRRSAGAACWAAIVLAAVMLSGWALLAKVFPSISPLDLYARLRAPFDYWNAVGLMAALGIPGCLWLGARRDGHAALSALAVPGARPAARRAAAVLRPRAAAGGRRRDRRAGSRPCRCGCAASAVLATAGAGAALVCAWAFSNDALTTDGTPLDVRADAGHSLGLLLLALLDRAAARRARARASRCRARRSRRRAAARSARRCSSRSRSCRSQGSPCSPPRSAG